MPRSMTPAELAQLRVVERLGTERDARDPGLAQGRRITALVGSRVGLERDLRVVRERETLPHPTEQTRDLVGRKQGRRATAEVHRSERRPTARSWRPEGRVNGIGPQLELDEQRVEELPDPVPRATRGRPGDDHEIAIGTERDAEREMD